MKRILMIVLLLTLSSTLFASRGKVVNLNANCFQNGGFSVSCNVCNYQFSRPLYCFMRTSGLSARGSWLRTKQSGVIFPGQCMNSFVRAINPYIDPLIDARSNVRCQIQ